MSECPQCNKTITGKELRNSFSSKPYRLCPHCSQPFCVDGATKRRKVVALVLAVVSLALTSCLHFLGNNWLIPSIASCIILGVFIYLANKRVIFVPYEKDDSTN